MDKTISNIQNLALSIFDRDDYIDFMSYVKSGEYNLARLFLDTQYVHRNDDEYHNRLEDILIDLIMKKEDGRGDESEQAIRNSG